MKCIGFVVDKLERLTGSDIIMCITASYTDGQDVYEVSGVASSDKLNIPEMLNNALSNSVENLSKLQDGALFPNASKLAKILLSSILDKIKASASAEQVEALMSVPTPDKVERVAALLETHGIGKVDISVLNTGELKALEVELKKYVSVYESGV